MTPMRCIDSIILCLALLLSPLSVVTASDEPYTSEAHPLINWPMYEDPVLEYHESEMTFPEGILDLWLSVLERPELDFSIRAAEAIGAAHVKGMPDVPARATEPLLRLLKSPDRDRRVHLAAARALVQLDAVQAAETLLEHNLKGDPEMVRLTDPALALWSDAAAKKMWNERLVAEEIRPAVLVSAIDSLRIAGDDSSVQPLLEIVQDRRRPVDQRLAAADALGAIARSGLETIAGKLAADTESGMFDRLAAAMMLSSHESEVASELLIRLAADAQPTVAHRAAGSLARRDPRLIAKLVDRYIDHRDVNLRTLAAHSLAAQQSAASVARLGGLLSDVNPSLRSWTRDQLMKLAADRTLAGAVRRAGMKALAGDAWQGLEQAALLLGQLDHEAAADRLIELLEHDRAEVRLASTAALRWLDVEGTYPAMLTRAETLAAASKESSDYTLIKAYGAEIAQLFQTFGVVGYKEAEPLMRKFLPKASYNDIARCGAIWALGKFHEDAVDNGLAGQLGGRLNDIMGMEPEVNTVRRMSAVTIGLMNAKSQAGTLSAHLTEFEEGDRVSQACRWALGRITGQPQPALTVGTRLSRDWFLIPIEASH